MSNDLKKDIEKTIEEKVDAYVSTLVDSLVNVVETDIKNVVDKESAILKEKLIEDINNIIEKGFEKPPKSWFSSWF